MQVIRLYYCGQHARVPWTDLLVTSIGLLGRGLAISRAYASVRRLRHNRLLREVPLFASTIAKVVLDYRANMHFTYFVAYLLGVCEQSGLSARKYTSSSASRLIPQSFKGSQLLLRLLTPILKARTAKVSIAGLQECMESLGGLGYLENEEKQEINISRLFRDANGKSSSKPCDCVPHAITTYLLLVLSIWEGTTDVMATDAVKTLKGRASKDVLSVLDSWFAASLQIDECTILPEEGRAVREAYDNFRTRVSASLWERLLRDGREVIEELGSLICAMLLIVDTFRDHDVVAQELCRRFTRTRVLGDNWVVELDGREGWDQRTAFSHTQSPETVKGSRL